MKVASALSRHVETSQAVVELLESTHRELDGAEPDLLALFVSPHHLERFDAVAGSLRDVFPGAKLVGCGATSVIGNGQEVEGAPGIGLLAARLPGCEVTPIGLTEETLTAIAERPDRLAEVCPELGERRGAACVVLLADPFTAGIEALVAGLDHALPGTTVLGGVASGADAPGGSRLVAGGAIAAHGCAALVLEGPLQVETVVAQGCRPIGQPMFVTRGEGHFIHELDGRAPMDLLQALFEQADARERALLQSSLFIGVQMEAGRSEYARGDYLIRNLIGADEDTGALAVATSVEPNLVVQFHLRDAHTASEDLELALRERTMLRERARGALLFSCLGRGQGLYGVPNHDSDLLRRHLGNVPMAGFFGNGEIGPVDQQTHLHAYTSAFGLLCEPETAADPGPRKAEAPSPSGSRRLQ